MAASEGEGPSFSTVVEWFPGSSPPNYRGKFLVIPAGGRNFWAVLNRLDWPEWHWSGDWADDEVAYWAELTIPLRKPGDTL